MITGMNDDRTVLRGVRGSTQVRSEHSRAARRASADRANRELAMEIVDAEQFDLHDGIVLPPRITPGQTFRSLSPRAGAFDPFIVLILLERVRMLRV